MSGRALCVALFLLCGSSVIASEAIIIPYEGRLVDASDAPYQATIALRLSIFERLAPPYDYTGATPVPLPEFPLWSETYAVTPVNGYFRIAVGATTGNKKVLFDDVFNDRSTYLAFTVDSSTYSLLPRLAFSPTQPAVGTSMAANHKLISGAVPPVDADPPVITFVVPTQGAQYALRSTAQVSYLCSDAISGVALCVGSLPLGAVLDTNRLGTYTMRVDATDNAGNATSTVVAYSVVPPGKKKPK